MCYLLQIFRDTKKFSDLWTHLAELPISQLYKLTILFAFCQLHVSFHNHSNAFSVTCFATNVSKNRFLESEITASPAFIVNPFYTVKCKSAEIEHVYPTISTKPHMSKSSTPKTVINERNLFYDTSYLAAFTRYSDLFFSKNLESNISTKDEKYLSNQISTFVILCV